MENASKALIIIGAILIALLLVSGGVYVLGLMSDPQDQAADSARSQSIEMFNSKFTPYAGEQRGSSVKQLVSACLSNNGTNNDHQVTLNASSFATTFSAVQSNVNHQSRYRVTLDDTDGDGYIDDVLIVTI